MPPRTPARVSIPDEPGLNRDPVVVGEIPPEDDPWGVGTAIMKTWADSFEDPHNSHGQPDEPNGPDYWFRADIAGVDFDVHFRLGVTDEGGLVVTGLLLGNPGGTQPITTSNLHRLPIGAMMNALYEAISRLDDVTPVLAEKARPFKGDIPTRGGQRTPEDEFKQAAQIYRQCLLERPNDTIKCVAERLGVSSATASRRVSRARDLGFLASDYRSDDEIALNKLRGQIKMIDQEMRPYYARVRNGELSVDERQQAAEKLEQILARKTALREQAHPVEQRLDIPQSERIGISPETREVWGA